GARDNLVEQAQHVLVGLRRERQRCGRQLLACLQGEQVRAFFVRVGQCKGRRTVLQRVDRRLREVLTDLHGREVRAEGLRFRTQRGKRRSQSVARRLNR